MAALRRNLGMIEAVGLSLSIIAPTMAMAFNVTLAAGAAGDAAPLAFAIGTVALAIVGLSFVAFSRRVSHAGSAYAYVAAEFGPKAGFVAGWALLLTYLCYGSAVAVMVGNFIDAALADYRLTVPGLWIVAALGAIGIAMLLAYRDMRLAARLMLALEAVSVLAIIALGITVLRAVSAKDGLSMAPLMPDPRLGWSGIGYAIVFAVLSFAGFEGAATLGEETANPRRAIPIAVFGTVILAGAFYVFASYVQVVGFGMANTRALAADSAPLDTLARRFGSRGFATLLDLAAAVSAFSCALGSLSAAARMLFALGRAGLAPRLGVPHPKHGTPAAAVVATGALMAAGIVLCAPFMGSSGYYGALGTIGTLSLILVYMAVTIAGASHALRARGLVWAGFGLAGTLILLWPLYNSVYPVPVWPGNSWPYLVIAWLIAGGVVLAIRPIPGAGAAAGSMSWTPPHPGDLA